MKLQELAAQLGISPSAVQRFVEDFDLDLNEVIAPDFGVRENFQKFAEANRDFLQKFAADLQTEKSAEDIAKIIGRPVQGVEAEMRKEMPALFENGLYKKSVSSFTIDKNMGGDYRFISDFFGNKEGLSERDFIGYRDLFFYVSDVLEPFTSPDSTKNWGIRKPAGIILYGPPGSGKIFWAKKISEIINYGFREVRKNYLGASPSGSSRVGFNDFLLNVMNDEKVLLFMEDFDEIMQERAAETPFSAENEETKEIVLQNISKFEQESMLMVGAANSLNGIDTELLAPGRFDVVIPVFPPNQAERAEMILYHLTEKLDKDALLFKILQKNGAEKVSFWAEISSKMKVFSNTMIDDFAQSIKRRLRTQYLKSGSDDVKIDENLLAAALHDAAKKLTDEYLNQVADFLRNARQNNFDDFAKRISETQAELDAYKAVEKPARAIGFTHNGED